MNENVASPKHYQQGTVETIYTIRDTLGPEGFKAYCMGNWIKYNARYQHKNGAEDLAKAQVYLGWAVRGLPKPVNGMLPPTATPTFDRKFAVGDEIAYLGGSGSHRIHGIGKDRYDLGKDRYVLFSDEIKWHKAND